jgi:hypothetical protein
MARGQVTQSRGDGYGRNERKKALGSHEPRAKIMTATPAKTRQP